MDLQPHSEPELNIVATTETTASESAVYTGAFFPNATGFTISGGVFTCNVINNLRLEQSSAEFRRITLGDMKLGKELQNISGTVHRHCQSAGVRRMYSAEISPDPAPVTVAIYQGHAAEEEWHRDLAKYEAIRHPNIMQLYGLVNTRCFHAMVFHHELIPYHQFLKRFQHSSILSTYFIGYCAIEFDEAINYLSLVFREPPTDYDDLTVLIRPTTGQVCLDLVRGSEKDLKHPWWEVDILHFERVSLDHPDAENMVIGDLDADKYHELCSMPSIAQYRTFTVSTQLPIRRAPMIFRSDSKQQMLFRIPEALDLGPVQWRNYGTSKHKTLPNSWIRYDSHQASNLHAELLVVSWSKSSKFWMAQANHIFTLLETTSHWDDYVFMDMAAFVLRCLPKPFNAPEQEGYLFVCPPEDFRTGANSFQWPSCPAYWSLDPSGASRLSPEEAKILGFAAIHIETVMRGGSWDGVVYEGLQKFHRGNGFDPYSQDMAIHLGYPLFEFLSEEAAALTYHEVEGWCHLENPALCQALGHCCCE